MDENVQRRSEITMFQFCWIVGTIRLSSIHPSSESHCDLIEINYGKLSSLYFFVMWRFCLSTFR